MTSWYRVTVACGALLLLTGLTACHEGGTTPSGNNADTSVDTNSGDAGGDGGVDNGGLDSTSTDGGPDGAVDATTDTTDPDVPGDTSPPTCENGCDDGNPCTTGVCDAASGTCSFTDVPTGTTCGDCGSFCLDGTCSFSDIALPNAIVAFECQGDNQCDDLDPCTTDTCDPATCGCSHEPIPGCGPCGPDGCDDGNPCTIGICGDAACEYTPVDDGTACGVCGAVCQAGECTVTATTADKIAFPAEACAVDSDCVSTDPCVVGTCTPESCTCNYVTLPDCGGCPDGCDDNDACTADSCVEGKCINATIPGCGGCQGGCNDGNPCTEDICTADGQCQHIAVEPCGGCTGDDECADNDDCTVDTCIVATGKCEHITKDDCVPCAVLCDDQNPCTTDTCGTDTECANTPIPGCGDLCVELCDDQNPCTVDTCNPATGQCMYSVIPGCNPNCQVDCDDQNDCTLDTCDPDTNECQHIAIPGCNPGCQDQCNDNNPCTIDKCSAEGTCAYETIQDGAPCGACGAVCAQGVCQGVPVLPTCGGDSDCLQDNDPCTKSVCVEQCSCEVVEVPNCGVTCDSNVDCEDQDPCTLNICEAGSCAPPVPNPDCPGKCTSDEQCADDDDCTYDFCDPNGACQNLPFPAPGCGTPPCDSDEECDDNDNCTSDACIDGKCEFLPTPGCTSFCQSDDDCTAGGPCSTGLCMDDGSCAYVTVPNCGDCTSVQDCFDNDPCTIDSCTAGQCTYATNPGCNPQTPSCNSQGVIDTFSAATSVGQTVKVAGVPVQWSLQTCTDIACSADNPCCNTCSNTLAIKDQAGAIESSEPTAAGVPWSATTDSCGELVSTQPPQMDSAYWVWGTVGVGGPAPPLPNGIAIALGQLAVKGWCIQTTPAGLPGTYKGEFSSANGQSYAVTLTIVYSSAGWTFSMTDEAGQLTFAFSDIVIGDGSLSFTLEASTQGSASVMPVTLYSNHNNLSGDLWNFSNSADIAVPPPSGSLNVTRIP